MRLAWLVGLLALRCSGYDLTGRIEPPANTHVFLQGVTIPFADSCVSGADGRFEFHKVAAGTYTLVISTAARGELRQTVELGAGTVDRKGRLELVLRISQERLESDGLRVGGATVSATLLSIPDRAMKEYQAAQRSLLRGEPDQAIGYLRRAVELAPQFSAAWNQLGTIAYQAHRFSDAETNFRRALDADPEAFEPLVNLGGVLLNLERPREAAGYNAQAVDRRPNDALANSQLGLSYLALGDPESAEKYLKIAVQLDPAHFSHPQLALAGIYVKRGDRDSAVRSLRGFLEQHPDSPQAASVRQEIDSLTKSERE